MTAEADTDLRQGVTPQAHAALDYLDVYRENNIAGQGPSPGWDDPAELLRRARESLQYPFEEAGDRRNQRLMSAAMIIRAIEIEDAQEAGK